MSLDVIIVLGLSIFIVYFALAKGGQPEQLVAAILAFSMLLDLLVASFAGPSNFETFSLSRIVIDTVELVMFLAVATYANRVWPLFSAAAQLVTVGGSLAVLGSEGGARLAYWALTQLPLLMHFVALGIGTWFHRRRIVVAGSYSDWRSTVAGVNG